MMQEHLKEGLLLAAFPPMPVRVCVHLIAADVALFLPSIHKLTSKINLLGTWKWNIE